MAGYGSGASSSSHDASASADSKREARDRALETYLSSKGALLDSVSGVRPCGLRGLFATRDLGAEEMACWIPNDEVLELSTCDPGLREAIAATLTEAGLSEVEKTVYERMMCLSAGLLLETARGTSSRFQPYVEALPEPPPTTNTFSLAEREVLRLMSGGTDYHAMYQPLVELNIKAVRRAADAGLWGDAPAPERDKVDAAFHFVLSRMSYMRMIPVVDLANAAMPGEENARICVEEQVYNGREGVAMVTKRPVAEGEELLIDYNHHHAIGMLSNYGCTMGLETSRSVTTIQFSVPPWLQELGGGAYARGVQLQEEETAALPEQAILILRMSAMGGLQEVIEAVEDGYFKDVPTAPHEKKRRWDSSQRTVYLDLARFCAERRQHWEENIGPIVKRDITATTFAGEAIVNQYDTELRLLRRCEEEMLRRAALMAPAEGVSSPLHLASVHGNAAVARLLAEKSGETGAKKEAKDDGTAQNRP